jgi:hypothetical protein
LRRQIALIFVTTGLAACSPQQFADDVTRQAAESVVTPILDDYMPPAQAAGATRCVLDNASPDEIRALARDVAVQAGTTTVQNVLNIATRPGTLQCFATIGASIIPDNV